MTRLQINKIYCRHVGTYTSTPRHVCPPRLLPFQTTLFKCLISSPHCAKIIFQLWRLQATTAEQTNVLLHVLSSLTPLTLPTRYGKTPQMLKLNGRLSLLFKNCWTYQWLNELWGLQLCIRNKVTVWAPDKLLMLATGRRACWRRVTFWFCWCLRWYW